MKQTQNRERDDTKVITFRQNNIMQPRVIIVIQQNKSTVALCFLANRHWVAASDRQGQPDECEIIRTGSAFLHLKGGNVTFIL